MKIGTAAFVALGSNLGNSIAAVQAAMAELQSLSDEPILKSSLWQTAPVDCPPGSPPFINAVVGLQPRGAETPATLLHQLQKLETKAGRQLKKVLNEPRVLDLDLIVFGPATFHSSELTVPHPRAQQRRFVLQPLSEIAPDLILPGQTTTVLQLLQELKSAEKLERIVS